MACLRGVGGQVNSTTGRWSVGVIEGVVRAVGVLVRSLLRDRPYDPPMERRGSQREGRDTADRRAVCEGEQIGRDVDVDATGGVGGAAYGPIVKGRGADW